MTTTSRRFLRNVSFRLNSLFAVPCILALLSTAASAQVTPGFDFETDATVDTDADTRWEDTVGGNPSTFDFELAGSVTRNTGVSTLTGIGAAYEFVGGTTGNVDGALLSTTDTATRRSFQNAPGDWTNNEDVTIEVWFRPQNLTPTPINGQILFEDGGGTGFGFFVDNNELRLRKAPNNGNVGFDISELSSEFIQAVGTFDNAGGIELFINGASVGTASPAGNDWSGGDAAAVATRGATNTGGIGGGQSSTESFDGEIALFRVYRDQILTPAEVLANFAAVAQQEDVHWDNGSTDTSGAVTGPYAGTDLWQEAVNWRVNSTPGTQGTPPNDVRPTIIDQVSISLNDTESADVPARISTGDAFEVSSVRIGGNFGLGTGGDGILNVEQGGSLTVSGNGLGNGNIDLGTSPRDGKLNISTGGQVTVANGGLLRIGVSGTDASDLSEVTISDAASTLTVDGQTRVATSGRGRMIVNDGTVNLNGGLRLGGLPNVAANNRGDVTQNGGAVNVTGDLVFGGAAGTEGGTYLLNGGTLSVTGNVVETASNVDSAQLYVNDPNALSVTGNITVQSFRTGDSQAGSHTVASGQTVTTTGTLLVGRSAVGTLTLQSTGNVAANMTVSDAAGGAGSVLTLENAATLSVTAGGTTALDVGDANGSDGTININTGSTLTSAARVDLGQAGTASGTINVNDGLLDINGGGLFIAGDDASDGGTTGLVTVGASGQVDVNGGNTEIGRGGTGTLTIDGGDFNQNTTNLVLAQTGGSSTGTVTINSGTLDVGDGVGSDSDLNLNGGTGGAFFNHNGGDVTVERDLQMATATSGSATYTMSATGGSLTVGRDLEIGEDGPATFNISDGTVDITRNLVNGFNGTGALNITGSAATISVDGSYTQNASSALDYTLTSGTATTIDVLGTDLTDTVTVDGSLSFDFSGSGITNAVTNGDILLIDNALADPISGLFVGWPEGTGVGVTFGTTTYALTYMYDSSTGMISPTGNDLALVAIPEPGTLGLVLLGIAGLALRRRRRRS